MQINHSVIKRKSNFVFLTTFQNQNGIRGNFENLKFSSTKNKAFSA
jgi:hypothetical protein